MSEKPTIVFISYCENMIDPNGVTKNVAYYTENCGELKLKIIPGSTIKQELKEVLVRARETCVTLEDIIMMFNSPHSSLFVGKTQA